MAPLMTLVMSDVWFRYRGSEVAALQGVTLAARPGEAVGLFGPNGAGKSTLTRLAMALLHPNRGVVTTVGRDTRGAKPEDLAPVCGYLFQQPESQLFEQSVRAELAFGPTQLGWQRERIEAKVAGLMAELSLVADAERHPYDLPAARRRIVALGAALMVDPPLLILDEPTAGLDRDSRKLVEQVVVRRREAGSTVVAVTHDMEFAMEALDRAVIIDGGAIAHDLPLVDAVGAGLLPEPPLGELSRRLDLSPRSLRLDDVAGALVART